MRLFQGDQEISSTDLRVQGAGLHPAPLQNGAAPSWNLHLPAELVNPGLGVLLR